MWPQTIAILLGIADLSRVTDVSPVGKHFSVMEAYCGQLYHYGAAPHQSIGYSPDQNCKLFLQMNTGPAEPKRLVSKAIMKAIDIIGK